MTGSVARKLCVDRLNTSKEERTSKTVDKNIRLVDKLDDNIVQAIDRVVILEDRINKVKASIKGDEKELKELKSLIKSFAKEKRITVLDGNNGIVKFSRKTTKEVDVKKLFLMLQREKRLHTFWKYIKGVIKNISKDYGSEILEKEGIISFNEDEFGNMKIARK